MSRTKSVIGLASRAVALLVVVGLALRPEAVSRRVDEVLSASWKVLSNRLANRELQAMARQLDCERQNVERIAELRDGHRVRLLAFEAIREQMTDRLVEGGRTHRADPER